MREIERAEVVRRVREAGEPLISFFWCDNIGIIRSKSTHISGLECSLDLGIGVTTAMQAIGDMDHLQVVAEIIEALEAQGVRIEQYHTEVGHGQHELSIRHAPALRATDNHIIYQRTVRNLAYRHGMYASFAPKPFPEQADNGWDLEEKKNLFYDAQDADNISDLAYHFIGGVMAHLPGLVSLTCPSMNSYGRLSPGSWSTTFTRYGRNNCEAALRIPLNFWGSDMASTKLEFCPDDNSSNPHIVLGDLIAAGIDGIKRELNPSTSQRVDTDHMRLPEEEFARRDTHGLPSSMTDGTRELERDTALLDAMGPLLANSYLA